MLALWSDVSLAVRAMVRSPRFALTAILALALGIGPNTAIFSIVYGTLLAPLPYPDPDQLVMVWSKEGDSRARTSPAEYLYWKERATTFQYLEPFWARQFNLATPEAPERVRARQVSPDGHRMYGKDVWLGRDFRADEDQSGKSHVVLLTHRLWRERFGSDPGLIGRDIRMDAVPYTVIGILRPGERDRLPADLWIPLSFTPQEKENRQFRPLLVAGRLKPNVTIQQAQAEMSLIASDLAQQFPDSNRGRTISVEPLQNNFLSTDVSTNLWLLLAAVSFVVLIASVNVTNLLLARGAARQHETALRTVLGASPARIARQILTESLVLAMAGGVLGALSSVWILHGILGLLPPGTLPSEADPRLRLPVLLFTLGIATFSGLLCGVAQIWHGSRLDLFAALRQSGRSSVGSARRRTHRALVVVEFALAVTLLAGAGLTIVSFWNRTQIDLGVRTDSILTFALPVNEGRLTSAEATDAFYRQIIDGVKRVPGVVHAGIVVPALPLASGFSREFRIAGLNDDGAAQRWQAGVRLVSPGFLETFDIRIVQGRAISDVDSAGAQRVAVVNERFADLFLRGREPLGQRIAMNGLVPRGAGLGPGAAAPGASTEWHIVGVFRNVSTAERFGDPSAPEVYLPFAQNPWPQVVAVVRSATNNPESLRTALAAAVQAIQADLPLTDVRTMQQIVEERLAPDRLNIALYGALAALAMTLAALGIYGVMAYAVAQRIPEIGLRLALGAGQTQVRVQVLREGLTLAAAGLLIGVLGAYVVGRAMQSTLYGIATIDVRVIAAAGVVLLASAALACYAPARRASAVDPLIALRQQ